MPVHGLSGFSLVTHTIREIAPVNKLLELVFFMNQGHDSRRLLPICETLFLHQREQGTQPQQRFHKHDSKVLNEFKPMVVCAVISLRRGQR